jgi:glycosyltransferase involved in cell wall biosynthesis
VLVVDDYEGYIDPAAEAFEVLGLDQIGLDDYERMAAAYDVTELSTAVKPWLLRHLLARDDCESVTYLDPDIWVTDDLEEVDRLAQADGLVLTPHFTAPIPRDGLKPNEEDILIAGTYNLGFISVRAGEESEEFLEWWSERLREDCVVDPAGGHFVDQRWVDLVPGIWRGFHLLRDPGYNLAYWNLPARMLEADGDRFTVDGQPLRFFHFSGFDPLSPNELSRHQNRIAVDKLPALSQICRTYANAVRLAGYEEARTWPYSWSTLPGGFELDTCSRRLYRRASKEARLNGSPFSRSGAEQLVAYLAEHDENGAPGTGVSRYLTELHETREDLRRAFPDLQGADGMRYIEWARINSNLGDLPPVVGSSGDWADAPGANGDAPPAAGVNLAGYFGSEMGVGEAARQIAGAMDAAGVRTSPIEVPVETARMPAELAALPHERTPFDVNLICVNADMLPAFAAAAGESFFANRHSIGMWFWEIEHFPARWHPSFEPLNEVWVASSHVARAIEPHAPIPVRTMRLPVVPDAPDPAGRAALGMPEGFCFLFVFDYRSVLNRKNPIGLIDAFEKAFGPERDVNLVIKTVGSEYHPDEASRLREAAEGRSNARLIEHEVSTAAKNAMIASCDCYVSLHRSEGFGLTLAEAMYFGKPVIATGYSGNLDFMTEENSYLVRHRMTRIGEDALPYPADAVWAEPDAGHAVKLMRRVVERPEEAAERGRLAADDLRRTHSPAAAGALIKQRLEEIAWSRAGVPMRAATEKGDDAPAGGLVRVSAARTPPRPGGTGVTQLRHLLEFSEAPAKPNAGRLRQSAKQAYLRMLRPYIAYQRRINQSTLQALDELQVDLTRRQAAAIEQTRGELERAEATARELDGLLRSDLEGLMRTELEKHDRNLEELGGQFTRALAEQRDGLHAEHQRILEALEYKSHELRATVMQDISLVRELAEDGLGRHEQRRAEIERADSAIEGTREAIGQVDARLTDSLEGARAEIEGTREAIGQVDARLTAQTGQVEARLEGPEDLVEASQTAPFMADDRFRTGEDPVHGTVLGFEEAGAGNGSGGYRGFEDIFRGSEEMIRDRQRVYLDSVTGFGPVLDIGSGRGEFLDLLEEAGIERRGVDIDPGMVACCHEKGHSDVAEADALDHLRSLGEHSIGCIFSAQVIEHLDYDDLKIFLERSIEVLRPGGLLIAETVNPHSARALKTFWVDPTHRAPLFPETMLALCQLAGYASAHVFCPNGSGDWETDRTREGEYAIVARSPELHAKTVSSTT